MRFDHIFIAFGIFAGAALTLIGGQVPAIRAVPALMLLLGAILIFDLAAAYIRGVPVMTSVSAITRAVAFVGGGVAMLISGGMW